MDADEERGGDEEGRRVQREECAQRHDRQEDGGEAPASDRERVGAGAHEPVRLLHVPSVDEGGEDGAVRRVEVARRSRQEEGCEHEAPERQVAEQAGDRDGHEHGAPDEIGRDHRATPLQPGCEKPSVEAEEEGGQAVSEPPPELPAGRPLRARTK